MAAVIVMLLILVIILIILMLEAAKAPMKPESWNDKAGGYIRCRDCISGNPDGFNVLSKPGIMCKKCPYCYDESEK